MGRERACPGCEQHTVRWVLTSSQAGATGPAHVHPRALASVAAADLGYGYRPVPLRGFVLAMGRTGIGDPMWKG